MFSDICNYALNPVLLTTPAVMDFKHGLQILYTLDLEMGSTGGGGVGGVVNSTQQIGSQAGGAEGSLCGKGSGRSVGTFDKSRTKLQRSEVQPGHSWGRVGSSCVRACWEHDHAWF